MAKKFPIKTVRNAAGKEFKYFAPSHTLNRETVTKTFLKYADAVAWKRKQEAATAVGDFVASTSKETVDEVFARWIKHKSANGLRDITRETYEYDQERYVSGKIGRLPLRKVEHRQLQKLLDDMGEDGFSRSTRLKVKGLFSGLWKFAKKQGLVGQNVALDLEVGEADEIEEEALDCPTHEQARAILEAAGSPYAAAVIATLLLTAMRASEARAIRWRAIDLDQGTAKIVERAGRRVGEIAPPKTRAGRRTIHLSPEAVAALSTWRMQAKHTAADDYVLGTTHGTVANHSNWYSRILGPAQIRAGIVRMVEVDGKMVARPLFGLHKMRHYSLSAHAEAAGGNLIEVARQAGHADITTTRRYSHSLSSDEERKKVAASAFRKLRLVG